MAIAAQAQVRRTPAWFIAFHYALILVLLLAAFIFLAPAYRSEHGHPHATVDQRRSRQLRSSDGKLQAINMPVLLLWGEQDVLTPLSWGKAAHRQIPGSELVILHGCGHIALFDCRPQALTEIQRFLSEEVPETGRIRTISGE